eukprot:m.201682 g.201682  ORF g.201682 m.201682 type:complete len:319 (+) comp21511_c0_seq1:277-1233(+)
MAAAGIAVIAGVLNLVILVLLLLLAASSSDNYSTVERLSWGSIDDGRVAGSNGTIDWCTQFYPQQTCIAMTIDVHLGSQRTALEATASLASGNVNDQNVSAYSQRCLVPDGGDICDGCSDAADVAATFLSLALVCTIAALIALYDQVRNNGGSRPTRVVVGGGGIVCCIATAVMMAVFEQDCLQKIPSHLSVERGACFAIAAFVFVIALGVIVLQCVLPDGDGAGPSRTKNSVSPQQGRRSRSRAQASPAPRRPSKVAPQAAAAPVERQHVQSSSPTPQGNLGQARRVTVNPSDDHARTGAADTGAIHAKFAQRGSMQ